MVKSLRAGQFNQLVSFLKRLDDIGDDFFLHGDVICPSVRGPANFPGMHFVRSEIPTSDKYANVIYGVANLNQITTEMGNIKGKKDLIEIEQTDLGIWVTCNYNKWQLAGIYSPDIIDENGKSQAEIAQALCPTENRFDTYLNSVEWKSLPVEMVDSIRRGSVCTLEDDRNTTFVRFGKDQLKLKGVVRTDLPVKFSLDVYIQSPESSEDTIVISSLSGGLGSGTLMIHMTDPTIECIHYYKYSPFK